MNLMLAQQLMDEFSRRTGIIGDAPPRRYLWTDAYAVQTLLKLYDQTGEPRYRELAIRLTNQVHHILGRHRDDDPRKGWISGLSEQSGEQHPTLGGLRIGKKLNERAEHEPGDPRLEWEQDGQYFHYLTRWIQALEQLARHAGEPRYHRWAVELADAAHRGFTRDGPDGGKRMVWKMSIDLSREQVPSMGHHDPLDALITCLELHTLDTVRSQGAPDLTHAITDAQQMCRGGQWDTDDPLGIGGLLDATARLSRLVIRYKLQEHDLLDRLLEDSRASLSLFSAAGTLHQSAAYRLPFRELGLSIGLHAIANIRELAAADAALGPAIDGLLQHYQLAEQIEKFWSAPEARRGRTWTDHEDINAVMLAASLSGLADFCDH